MWSSRFGVKVKVVFLSFAVSIFLIHIFVSIISNGFPGVQAWSDYYDPELLDPMRSMYGGGFDPEGNLDVPETGMETKSGKRFKLYEKKKMNHEKAKKFCKKREGSLAQAKNIDEMRRIQALLMRAKTVGGDIWVGTDKKEWQRHSSRMLGRQPMDLGPHATMIGGGSTQMCPALSSSTRSLNSSPCYQELPFVCEFEAGKGRLMTKKKDGESKDKPNPSKSSLSDQKKNKKDKKIKNMGNKRRDEMKKRRKRDIVKLPESDRNRIGMKNTSHQLSPTMLSTEMTTLILDESSTTELPPEMTSDTAFAPDASSSTPLDDENSTVAHHIGFIPHVVHVKQGEAENPMSTVGTNMLSSDVDGNDKTKRGDKNAEFHVKVSTKLDVMEGKEMSTNKQKTMEMVEPEPENTEINDNSLNKIISTTMEPTLLTNTLQLVSEADPDQAMLELINEHSELYSLDSVLDTIRTGHNLSFPFSMTSDYYISTMLSNLESTSTSASRTAVSESEARPGILKKMPREQGSKMSPSVSVYSASAKESENRHHGQITEGSEEERGSTERSTSYPDIFQEEPLSKNVSQSLLEPTTTIQLNNNDHKPFDSGKHHKNETNISLLLPLDEHSHKVGPASTTVEVKSTSTPSTAKTTPAASETTIIRTTTMVPKTTMESGSQIADGQIFTIRTTLKSDVVQRSITSAPDPATSATSKEPKTQTQETHEATTSVNNPSISSKNSPTALSQTDVISKSTTPTMALKMSTPAPTDSAFQLSIGGATQKDQGEMKSTIRTSMSPLNWTEATLSPPKAD